MHEPSADIVCFEEGSKQPPWIGLSDAIAEDKDALKALAQAGVVLFSVKDGEARISGADRVGLVQLPSGRRIVIRSKVESLVLLNWLAYLGDFPPLDSWVDEAGITTGRDFPDCIARLFLRELEKITRVHLRKGYSSVTSNESTIRGRILMPQLYRSFHRLPRLPQAQRARTLNTSYNKVLAQALEIVPKLYTTIPLSDCGLLARLREEWAGIRRDAHDTARLVTEVQWGSPPGYRAGLQLARLILVGASLDTEAGVGGQVFSLSLSSVWERGLRKMMEEIGEGTGWKSVPDSARTRLWDDVAGRTDPKRRLMVDVMAERAGVRWILDAKYKLAFGDESREDRFQMCAYAVAFNADLISLVYPSETKEFRRRVLLKTMVGLKPITIDSLNLPMRAGPELCKVTLQSWAEFGCQNQEN